MTKSHLQQVMEGIYEMAHAMNNDDAEMTKAERQQMAQFVEANLGELEERVTDWVTEAIDNSL